jgi:hypothetical protein
MICIARIFGAPVTDPGGNVARRISRNPTPLRRTPETVAVVWSSAPA